MPLFFVTAEGGIPVKDKPGAGNVGETIGSLDHLSYFEGSTVSKNYIQVLPAKVQSCSPYTNDFASDTCVKNGKAITHELRFRTGWLAVQNSTQASRGNELHGMGST
jgi:hypothetical protein